MTTQKFLPAEYFLQTYEGVITMCGSTRFFNEYMEAQRRITFAGWMFYTCGSFGHSYHKYHSAETELVKHDYAAVKTLHFQKIAMSDCIVVVHLGLQYYGDSTMAEMKFADYLGKPIISFDGKSFQGLVNTVNFFKPLIGFSDAKKIVEEYAKIESLGF